MIPRIPLRLGAIVVLLLACALSSEAMAARPACRSHTVADGQSLRTIAKRYKVSAEAIREQNGLQPSKALRIGQKLEIPPAGGKAGDCGEPPKPATAKPTEPTAPTAPAPPAADKPERRPTRTADGRPIVDKPADWTQTQKSSADRGVNPCNTPDEGWGIYDTWSRAPSMGQMISPQKGGIARNGAFDVMFHFHGHEPVRKEWVHVMDGAVLVGIDLGIGSGPYQSAFRTPGVFESLVHSVEKAMADKTGNAKAHVRKVGLSGWSAGYGAVVEILSHEYGKRLVDTVVLLDGMHCGYAGGSLEELQLQPFIDFARRAAAGQKLMFVSHSSIIPPDYASTTETANYIIAKLGGKARPVRPRGRGPMGLELFSTYSRGNFHVRGYVGNDKMDHCAHIGLFRDILKMRVKTRWNSPKGRKS